MFALLTFITATLISIVSAAPVPQTNIAQELAKAVSDSVGTALTPLIGVASGATSIVATASNAGCFPALDFKRPDSVPSTTENWWCNADTEYGFLGFGYEVTRCQDKDKMIREFKDARENFDSRYTRIYGHCDRENFYDDLIDAAWEASIGVYPVIWFGFDGGDQWKSRKSDLWKAINNNPKAPFVVRGIQFGSEPLYDSAIAPGRLAEEVTKAKADMESKGIKVTISELAYGYDKTDKQGGDSKALLKSQDFLSAHTLPFFSTRASTGKQAWDIVKDDVEWFVRNADGKKVILSQNGWPSEQYDGVRPNSAAAVADIKNEADYFELLDSKCDYFKQAEGGGVGWFAHLYSDYMEPGYGILDTSGKPKFDFHPRTKC